MLRMQRAVRLHATQELHAARAHRLAVEQPGEEEVAVLLEALAQRVGIADDRIGGSQPPERVVGQVERASAGRRRHHRTCSHFAVSSSASGCRHVRYGAARPVTMVEVASGMHEMGPAHELLLSSPVDAGVGRWLLAGTIRGGRGVPAMRVLPSYAAVAVLRGPADYMDADGSRMVAHTGDVILVRPGVPHRYGARGGATWDERYVVFDGPLFDVCLAGGVFARTSPVA